MSLDFISNFSSSFFFCHYYYFVRIFLIIFFFIFKIKVSFILSLLCPRFLIPCQLWSLFLLILRRTLNLFRFFFNISEWEKDRGEKNLENYYFFSPFIFFFFFVLTTQIPCPGQNQQQIFNQNELIRLSVSVETRGWDTSIHISFLSFPNYRAQES